jgi:hypothetical protein
MKLKRTKIRVAGFSLVVFAGLFASCHRNSPSWDTQILAPIVNANLSINNIITSSYIKDNADNSVSLVFTDSLYNLNIDTLVTIPDTVLNYFYTDNFGITYTFTPGSLIFAPSPNPATTTYPIGSVELTEGILQSGYLTFTVTNPLSQPLDYTYQVLNVTKNGSPLTVYVVVPPRTSQTLQKSLSGYNVDFRGPSSNGYNDITTSIYVNLDSNATSSIVIEPGDTLAFAKVSFTNIIPYYAKGYFGTTTKTFGPQSEAFSVFNKIVAGTINLQSVSVTLTLTNAFGIDASLFLSELYSYNSRTKDTVKLNAHGVVGATIHINRAIPTNASPPASPVTPSIDTFSLTPANSNILSWLNNLPTALGYKLQVITDPLGNVSGSNDFAYYGYGISANINVNIPLSLIANNLTLADTLSVNFSGSTAVTQHVKSGTLTIYANNGFPFSAGLQMYLLNNNNVVYDSLFVPLQTIGAGIINASTGIVTAPSSSELTISLNAIQAQQLYGTKKIILYARFNMGNVSPPIYRKIYDYYQLGLKLIGNFDYEVN